MIYDKLDNIETYEGISPDILLGLKWLRDVSPDVENGVYEINLRVNAIVSEYMTKEVNENGYEAHKKNIDVQYLLKGEERIACLPIDKLKETTPYSEEKDAAFYSAEGVKAQEMIIGDGYFAVFYPQDGHMPQLSVDRPQAVKKIVVKVEIFTWDAARRVVGE